VTVRVRKQQADGWLSRSRSWLLDVAEDGVARLFPVLAAEGDLG
jgi:hypothetical protein